MATHNPVNAYTLTWNGLQEGFALTRLSDFYRSIVLMVGPSYYIPRFARDNRGCDYDEKSLIAKRLWIGEQRRDGLDPILYLIRPSSEKEGSLDLFFHLDCYGNPDVKTKHRYYYGVETDAQVVATDGHGRLLHLKEEHTFANVFFATGEVARVEREGARLVKIPLPWEVQARMRLDQARKALDEGNKTPGDKGVRMTDMGYFQLVAICDTAENAASRFVGSEPTKAKALGAVAEEAKALLRKDRAFLRGNILAYARKHLGEGWENTSKKYQPTKSKILPTSTLMKKAEGKQRSRRGFVSLSDLTPGTVH